MGFRKAIINWFNNQTAENRYNSNELKRRSIAEQVFNGSRRFLRLDNDRFFGAASVFLFIMFFMTGFLVLTTIRFYIKGHRTDFTGTQMQIDGYTHTGKEHRGGENNGQRGMINPGHNVSKI